MDTLVDNRKFPEEMHEQAPQKKSGTKRTWKIFLLVLLGLLVLAGVLFIAIKKKGGFGLGKPAPQPIPLSAKEEQKNLEDLESLIPQKNQEQRDEELQLFFN